MARTRRSSKKVSKALDFPVVGIGASAGGLEAFTALLKALPTGTGMAFVLIQHMDPTHDSLLHQLLATATEMPVAQVVDGMRPEPDRVYVIPPNKTLTLEKGVLRLKKRPNTRMPIDTFFSSLAMDRKKNAIGVILSGTASDGTVGLKAIKNSGGTTFAQDPKSAKYNGMPMSAIAAGSVDFVMPPQEIALHLHQRAGHSGLAVSVPEPELENDSGDLRTIFRLLKKATDVDFSLYKLPTIRRRLRRRMSLLKTPDVNQYARYLESRPSEISDLFNDILIPVTAFFREPKTFRVLQEAVLPKIVANARKTKSIRIWVAGCSTGEEVYSIAMALLECLDRRAAEMKVQIFGTDINDRVIQIARNGLYTNAAVRNVSRDRLRRFFVKTEGGYQISKAIRESCIFARHDFATDPPFARLDLISCQNVFIYLGTVLQQRIMGGFHYALKADGFLVLGKSEVPIGYTDFFDLKDRKNKIFTRKLSKVRHFVPVPIPLTDRFPMAPGPTAASTVNLHEEARRVLLDNYSPPAFIVDSDLNILHFQRDTSPFVRPSSGAASLHLLRMLRPELALDLRSLTHQAQKEGRPVRKEGIEVEHGPSKHVVVEVVPFHAANSASLYFIVSILKLEPALPDDPGRQAGRSDKREVEVLRRELAATRKSLQSITEDQEAANEELRTASEEILSSNEELSSTNEELETATEELQASNEELNILNEELQGRNLELSTLADDLSHLLTGVNIPVLVLDNNRRIQQFTPSAQPVFNLIPTDVGRPFRDISSNLEGPDWNELLSRVAEQLQIVEIDVAGRDGRSYLLKMRPYKTNPHGVDGVLIALLDVDRLKRQLLRTQANLKTTEDLYRLIAENTRDLVSLHSADSKFIYSSPSREKLLGYSQQEIIGKRPADFCHREDRKMVEAAFSKAAQSRTSSQVTYRLPTKDGREVWIEALISPLTDGQGKVTRVQMESRDITERKQVYDSLHESESTNRMLLETASQGIVAVDVEGRIVLTNRAAEQIFGYAKDELFGKSYFQLVPRHLRAQHKLDHKQFFVEPKTRPMGLGLNLFGLHKNGETFPIDVSLSYIATKKGLLGVAFVTDISERKRAEADITRSHEKVLTLTRQALTAKDEESKRIARDLHDTFTQELAALATESRLLQAELPPDAHRAAEKLDNFAKRIGQLATDIQHVSRRLHPAILDLLGLPVALRSECTSFSQLNHIRVDYSSTRVTASVPGNVALCLYRVAQESLQNIAKHSKARRARVELTSKKGEISLAIEDFGNGFDRRKQKKAGLGLTSMEERVNVVGGRFTIDSQPGKGTRVLVRVPLQTKP